MRFALFSLVVALLAAVAMAVPPKYVSLIVSWQKKVPDSVVQDAMDMVVENHGRITHRYSELVPSHALSTVPCRASGACGKSVDKNKRLTFVSADIIQGFACEMPQNDIPKIEAMNTAYPPTVETDGYVTTQGDDKKGKDEIHF
jgi:hypothetical protein